LIDLRKTLRLGFMWFEGWLDLAFGIRWNPLYHLGALGYFYFWVVTLSGIYLYIFFDTGISAAYASVEYLTVEQWWLGGVMRSFHRYASDALMVMMLLHMVRLFAFDKYRGGRWYSWITGVPVFWMVFVAGITGYWLVWDTLAQYVAVASTEFLDWLPIFGEPIARNFLAPSNLDDRFFTLLVFLHIAVPLFTLFMLWFHLLRVSHAKVNPARGLGVGTLAMLLGLSLVKPATSQGAANLAQVPTSVAPDWFYLWPYPLMDIWPAGLLWGLALGGTVFLVALPWLPPGPKEAVAEVDLDNCNGCGRCADDCPFSAITMGRRTDGKPFEAQAVVDPGNCLSCGICAGACPTAMPFRRASALAPGIQLPDFTIEDLRDRTETAAKGLGGSARVLVFGCDHGCRVDKLASDGVGAVSLPCAGMLPPSFIDYALSRDLADGVLVTGCRDGECHFRLGVRWTDARLDGVRDPRLRARVAKDRIARTWAAPTDWRRLEKDLAAFRTRLEGLSAAARSNPTGGTPVDRATAAMTAAPERGADR